MTLPRIDSCRSLSIGISLVATIAATQLSAQAVREHWRHDFPSVRLVLDHHNNICTNTRGPELDYYARKVDPQGNELWVESYGDPQAHDHSRWLAVDSLGNILLTGHRSGQGLLTVKFGNNGGVLWAVQDSTVGEGYRVEVDASDNVYVGASFAGNVVLIKYDPLGNELWRQQRSYFNDPHSMAVTSDGTVAMTGGTTSWMATVVFDTNGNELYWDTRPGSSGQDVAFGPDGSVYVCGGAVGLASLLVGFDPNGNEKFETQNIGPNGPFGYAVRLAVDSAGNVAAVGHCSSTTAYMDWLIYKVDPAGNVLWTRTYDGFSGNDEFAKSVAVGPEDSIYVGGSGGVSGVCSPIPGLGEVVRRYDAQGNLVWHHEEACGGTIFSIVIERFGDVVMGGGTSSLVWMQQRDWMTLGSALAGTNGDPELHADGYLDNSGQLVMTVDNARASSPGVHIIGFGRSDFPLLGGTLVPMPQLAASFQTDAFGQANVSLVLPHFLPLFTELYLQSWVLDPVGAQGIAATNAVTKALQ